ncbi:hypothetical protein A9Q96_07095 [Rhodobacterales bacterium 52_120_T64]|nr:hypothetical protein A9Q96_07095 [Rhodobacterales bacterium 52_120_T64]
MPVDPFFPQYATCPMVFEVDYSGYSQLCLLRLPPIANSFGGRRKVIGDSLVANIYGFIGL